MSRFVDRERDARLLPHLDEATARLLFPERFVGPTAVTFVHPPLQGKAAHKAQALIAGAHTDTARDPSRPGSPTVACTTFGIERVEAMHDFYGLLEASVDPAAIDILIDGKRVPLVRELWLPLLWNLRR